MRYTNPKGIDMNYRQILLCTAIVLFPLFATAQQCGTYTGPMLIDGFGPPDKSFTQEPEPTLPPDSTALSLTITAPSNNAIVGTRTVQVYGTYAGPPATGVAVNKAAAVQTATDYVSSVVLKPGTNTITVKVTQLTGETQTLTRTVTYDPLQQPEIELTATLQGEHAPIKPSFTLTPGTGLVITRVQLDYDGNGTFDLDTSNASTLLKFEYKTPGFLSPSATVTLDDGNPNTPPIVRTVARKIAIVPLPLTRKTLCYVFYRMKSRLAANDIPDAVKSVNADFRAEVQADFNLLADPADGAQRMGTVGDGTIGIRLATLTLDVVYENQPIATSITLERASDGVWRITSM
jgi:hypothetical protein